METDKEQIYLTSMKELKNNLDFFEWCSGFGGETSTRSTRVINEIEKLKSKMEGIDEIDEKEKFTISRELREDMDKLNDKYLVLYLTTKLQ